MKRKHLRDNCWYNDHEYPGQINNEPSMTVPNQSLTVKQILEKHVNGIRLSIGKVGIYDEEADIDDVVLKSSMDVTEVQELYDNEVQNLKSKASIKKTAKNSLTKEEDFSGKIEESKEPEDGDTH